MDMIRIFKGLAKIGETTINANTNTLSLRPVANGFIMDYDEVEEYDVKVPIFPPPTIPPRPLQGPRPLTIETRKKWKITRKEVFCPDAAAIKIQIDIALGLAERVKKLQAEKTLLGEADDTVMGM